MAVLRQRHSCRERRRFVQVKNKRNKIAHGECSLSDAGKNVKLEGLKKTVTSVECLLNECMLQTEDFLMNHRYLDPSN